MTKSKAKTFKGSTVRIWDEPKERLKKVVKKKTEKEGRTVSEAELTSKAVSALCDEEEKTLGIA